MPRINPSPASELSRAGISSQNSRPADVFEDIGPTPTPPRRIDAAGLGGPRIIRQGFPPRISARGNRSSYTHRGTGAYRAEVADLSRNVIVESADPSVRGHTMYHRYSDGAISYAEAGRGVSTRSFRCLIRNDGAGARIRRPLRAPVSPLAPVRSRQGLVPAVFRTKRSADTGLRHGKFLAISGHRALLSRQGVPPLSD
jgi:hypothetical protein